MSGRTKSIIAAAILAAFTLGPLAAHAADVGSGLWTILKVYWDDEPNGFSAAQVFVRYYQTRLDCDHDMLPMFKAGRAANRPYNLYCVFVPM